MYLPLFCFIFLYFHQIVFKESSYCENAFLCRNTKKTTKLSTSGSSTMNELAAGAKEELFETLATASMNWRLAETWWAATWFWWAATITCPRRDLDREFGDPRLPSDRMQLLIDELWLVLRPAIWPGATSFSSDRCRLLTDEPLEIRSPAGRRLAEN